MCGPLCTKFTYNLEAMEPIKLNDILKFKSLEKVKIRLNLSNSSWNALDLYHNDVERLLIGNFHNSEKKRWFKENEIVIGLAQITGSEWLLIDISRISKSYNNFWDGKSQSGINSFYEHEKIREYEKYFGRLIVQFHKKNAYVTLKGNRIDDFVVKSILLDSLDQDEFPGYDKVNISWKEMQRLLKKDTWKTALQNQKGVYLIADISNGKKYVGSAYGEYMLLGRWKSYIKSGHGNNTGLKELSFDHIKQNFRYSILDIYKSSTNDQIIIEREGWWKEVLLSRKYGYNNN
jgi:hypothetical protein